MNRFLQILNKHLMERVHAHTLYDKSFPAYVYIYLIFNMSSFLTFLGSQPWGPLEHLMSITQWHEMNLKMELFTSCTSCIISHHYHSRSQIYFRIFKERVDWALNLCRKSSALSIAVILHIISSFLEKINAE